MCDNFLYLFQGRAFGAPGRPVPTILRTWSRIHRGRRWTSEGSATGSWVGGEPRRWWAAARPAALALGTHGAGRRRSAIPPHPPSGGSRRHAPPVTAPAEAARPSSCARRPCRRESSQPRALRPATSASPAMQGQAPDCELPRQDRRLSEGRRSVGLP
jgi:hypothetical protein